MDLWRQIQSTFQNKGANQYQELFCRIDSHFLIFDDALSTHTPSENSTNWGPKMLYQLIDYRYEKQLPTIITSNFKLKELCSFWDPMTANRVNSRLRAKENILVEDFSIQDQRQPNEDE